MLVRGVGRATHMGAGSADACTVMPIGVLYAYLFEVRIPRFTFRLACAFSIFNTLECIITASELVMHSAE